MSESSSESLLGVAARDLARLRTVAGHVARHGFGGLLSRSAIGRRLLSESAVAVEGDKSISALPAAVRFKQLLETLGPTYIKLGQILSSRPDRLPRAYIEALQSLQDCAPRVEFADIETQIEAGLGQPLQEIFAEFDREPLGMASIAQTHLATTHDGERVVVKVQRPGIEAVMRGDLDLLYLGAKLLEASIEEMSLYQPSEIVVEFERALLRELNFHHELQNLLTARKFLVTERQVTVPRPYSDLSCKTVLTMEFFDGKPIRALECESPEAKHAVSELIHSACRQVLFDGFFHGDPHGGNILINDDGLLCMIDFGLVGRLSRTQQDQLVTLMTALFTDDVDSIARVLLAMGTPTQRINMAQFKAEILRIRTEYIDSFQQIASFDTGGFIQEFVGAAQRFRIKLAPEYSILVKAAITIEGLNRSLDPQADLMAMLQPYAQEILQTRLSPDRLMKDAFSGAGQMGSLLQRLPNQVDQVLHDLETGNLQVNAVNPSLDEMLPVLQQLASRLVLVGFAATMSICAALLLPNDPTRVLGLPLLSLFCIVSASVVWAGLLGWQAVREGKPVKISPLLNFLKRN